MKSVSKKMNSLQSLKIEKTRNSVKPTKIIIASFKKEITQYFDKDGFLSWSSKKKKYIILGTNSPKEGLVECPQCHIGQLMIIRSPKTRKRFMGCSNYYNGCNASSPLLQKAKLRALKSKCIECSWPMIIFRYSRKEKWIKRCANFNCKTNTKASN